MNGVVLECDTEEKDLGVTFDADLKFSTHIRNIAAKANSRVGIIKRTFSTAQPRYNAVKRVHTKQRCIRASAV